MKIKIDVFGLKKWYKQLLDENFYKFLISLGLLASAPVIASVLFDYIVIYGNGRFKAGLLLGIVLLLLFLLLSFIQYCDLGGNQQQYYGSAAYDAYYQRLSDDLAGLRQFILFFQRHRKFCGY